MIDRDEQQKKGTNILFPNFSSSVVVNIDLQFEFENTDIFI